MKRKIYMVIDRSGSMHSIKDDTEGGVNTFLAEQAQEQDTRVTLVQFDNDYEVVCADTPIAEVPTFELQPRGMTALLDAIGRTVTVAKTEIKAIPKEERPEQVVLVIVTDGCENSSREFGLEQIRKLLKKRQEKGWLVLYLGANQDAIKVGGAMGIRAETSITYDASEIGTKAVYAAASGVVSRSMSGPTCDMAFTDQERKAAAPASD